MPPRRPTRTLGVLILVLIPVGVALTCPWAFHIGGRWTPLIWSGSGTLTTKSGRAYPLFLTLYPSSSFSRLRAAGLNPTGGVQGTACLCTSSQQGEVLKLSGTIYNGWWSTDGSRISVRLMELTILDVGQPRAGYFDLTGRWQGQDLILENRAEWSAHFRSGQRIDPAGVQLHWVSNWNCKSDCSRAGNF